MSDNKSKTTKKDAGDDFAADAANYSGPASGISPEWLPPAGADLGTQVGPAKLKQQEEAEEEARRINEKNALNAQKDAADRAARKASGGKPLVYDGDMIEVQLLKKYTPEYWEQDDGSFLLQGEVKQTLPKGSTVKLPKTEAARALSQSTGIATTTARTFD